MNHYKYIILSIQDMASSDLVGSVHDYHVYGDYAKVTSKPLTYYVPSDDIEALLKAKEVMEHTLDNIYLCKTSMNGIDFVWVPAYINSLSVYNINLNKAEDSGTYFNSSEAFKKLPKGRFQLSQAFGSKPPGLIELIGGEEF